MYAPPPADPRWSMAIVRDNESKTAGPYAVGAKIREATIDDIEEDRIYLDFGGGRREYLELVERAGARRRAPTVAAAPAPSSDRSPPSWIAGSRRRASTPTRCSGRPSTRCWGT